MTPESIRKRYFICARHFASRHYKNAESRSLNQTAVPHLNLDNLDDIKSSKAFLLPAETILNESPGMEIRETTKASGAVRILNPGANQPSETEKVLQVVKRPAAKTSVKPKRAILSNEIQADPVVPKPVVIIEDVFMSEPSPKRSRKSSSSIVNVQAPPESQKDSVALKKDSTDKISPRRKAPKPKNVLPPAEEPKEEVVIVEEPQNKLLALIEVTREQYERLSNSLSTAERSDHVSSLLSYFDKADTDPESSNDGNKFLITFRTFPLICGFSFNPTTWL